MTESELEDFKEFVHNNGELINWNYWASLQYIVPKEAAKLAYFVDPKNEPPTDLVESICEFERWLERQKPEWTLQEIANALDEHAPYRMIEALKNAPPVQQDVKPKEPPSLLNTPQKKDDWFEVINEAVNQFYAEHGVMPTSAQTWSLLCDIPPAGYAITTGTDKGETCLIMAGKKLSYSAFKKRITNYTK